MADLTAFVMCRETDLSPLVRGRLFTSLFLAVQFRFIPSYEGQTRFRLQRCGSSTIHPLLRGADLIAPSSSSSFADSSPLARGRQAVYPNAVVYHRFIPSCEGQTLNVYAAFSRLKYFVVQFAQMLFLPHPYLQYVEKPAAFSFFKCFFFNSHHKRHSGSV